MHMVIRQPFTRWERDRLGKLVLRQATYRVVGRPHVLERGMVLRDAAMVSLASGLWFFAVLVIALQSLGCASADGNYPIPPGSSSPEAQPVSSPGRDWCCATDGYLTCGLRTRLSEGTCYCAGIVHGDECEDATAWTPGTFCTQGYLLCFEEE